MGLVPSQEHAWALDAVAAAADMAARHIDLDAIVNMAENDARCLPPETATATTPQRVTVAGRSPRIGIIRDSAFQFYYPENIDALAQAGAKIIFTSPLADETLPALDGLYIGGGFPETHAEALSGNRRYREAVKTAADGGMPIYGECGGLMYLGRELVLGATTYPMAGVLPIVFGFSRRPQGHGYTVVSVDRANPFYPEGREIRGHEFHYSSVLQWDGTEDQLVFHMIRGSGITGGRDGLCYKNVLATYSHTHALGNPGWAESLVALAAEYRRQQEKFEA